MAGIQDSNMQRDRGRPKRLVMCCDGTWMDQLGKTGNEPASNVTRLSRVLRRTCSDGTPQIISYFPGVGTANALDKFTGGAFGMGLDRDIREVYNFICANYVDGDSVILIGFSRGAFTARSVADMVASLGLLTPDGLDHFYAVFEDYENMGDKHRRAEEFLVPALPEYGGQEGEEKIMWENRRMRQYKLGLKSLGYTRDTYQDGVTEITIKALGVWDTVGTLGIPPAPVVGVRGSADQWRFTNTQISDKVENAFQALALDEPRYAFRPALWERIDANKTNLKQVWFPGSHSNIGGGWPDQQIASITLAWMCDQLSTVGVEFSHKRLTATFAAGLRYSAAHPFPSVSVPFSPSQLLSFFRPHSSPLPWARPEVYHTPPTTLPVRDEHPCDGTDHHPDGSQSDLWRTARPWGLGQICRPTSTVQMLAGTTVRRPGLGMRVDPDTNESLEEPLLRTSERIHSCVRVRLACHGLGLDDGEVWKCDALLNGDHGTGPLWRLERGSGFPPEEDERLRTTKPPELALEDGEYPISNLYPVTVEDNRWRWVFVGRSEGEGDDRVPQETALPEEPMVGYWERSLLAMTVGQPDVWRFSEGASLLATVP
ncbi:peptidoglycan binding domain-containing protein [Coniochaeta sp. PMI_546]|nr:peptidoglycan binding domain-containing protein [Coniochaeta sp. PMI_546]